MKNQRKHISLLAALLLVFGFQLFGNQSMLYAASQNAEVTTNGFDISNGEVQPHNEITAQFSNVHKLHSEVSEIETEEEEKLVHSSPKISVLYTYYTSCLEINFTAFENLLLHFDASVLVSPISLYLQLEDFRL